MSASPSHSKSFAAADAKLRKAFGVVLRQRRNELALTQAALANASEMNSVYISRLELGVRLPALTTLYRLAPALKLSVGEIVERIDAQIAQDNRKARKPERKP